MQGNKIRNLSGSYAIPVKIFRLKNMYKDVDFKWRNLIFSNTIPCNNYVKILVEINWHNYPSIAFYKLVLLFYFGNKNVLKKGELWNE